jgi:hypothetical protein
MENVISICNAGRHEHGEKHWFWCEWINVHDHAEWNEQEPTASGFCESKSMARQAAWDALYAAVPEKKNRRAYKNGWAWQFLWLLRERDTRSLFSRCCVGKNRWLWVVVAGWELLEEPIATGFSDSPEAAKRAAEKQVPEIKTTGNWAAHRHWGKLQAIKRSQSETSSSAASPIDFVYTCSGDFITKWRIVKRTKKRIYVERHPYQENQHNTGDWQDWVERTFVLDRTKFETIGKLSVRQMSRTFYSSPEVYLAEKRSHTRLECHLILDVESDATEKQIKSAYKRLARTAHPDMGGTSEEFKRVRQAFENAVAIIATSG